jgi:hypothetical protein
MKATSNNSSSKRQDDDDENENENNESSSSSSSHGNKTLSPEVLSRLAIFGDSSWALFASFFLLVVAVGIAWVLDNEGTEPMNPVDVAYPTLLGPVPKVDPPRIFQVNPKDKSLPLVTQEMRDAFDKDGVIAVRGLLLDNTDLWNRLDVASQALVSEQQAKNSNKPKPKGSLTNRNKKSGSQFFTVKQGAIFLEAPQELDHHNNAASMPPLLEVALLTDIPKLVAELLQLNNNNQNVNTTLRLLRDIFLAKDDDEYICGWHVDDTGFWPATADAPGVNAWLALDDMPLERGGGFALAVGSHTAHWKDDAYHVTGSTHTFPYPQGFTSAADMLEHRVGNGTCNIQTSAPLLHQRMEETKRIYSLQKGDVIFHTRWLFHRTVPFERSAVAAAQNNHNDNNEEEEEAPPLLMYRRYSIRYGPGWSEIPRGFGTEPSVLWDERNGGRTADEVASLDAPWYPQAWPNVIPDELKQLRTIAEERLPKTTEIANARKKQMRPRRNRHSRQPH